MGPKRWLLFAKEISSMFQVERAGKQCRERWCNHLDPLLNSSDWSPSEEDAIFKLSKVDKNQWSKIAKSLPGRSENSIKNYYYSTVRKNLRRINKRLIFKENLTGPIKELAKNPLLSSLIFCNVATSELNSEIFLREKEEERRMQLDSESIQAGQETNAAINRREDQNYNEVFLLEMYHAFFMQYYKDIIACSFFTQ